MQNFDLELFEWELFTVDHQRAVSREGFGTVSGSFEVSVLSSRIGELLPMDNSKIRTELNQ